ncbi:hypothetical protein BDV3_003131 [Batrachochytrium dendrobatidis]|nr:hypothetical protein BDEG_28020 [Batrachochytrium dendrobatidis JEL423]
MTSLIAAKCSASAVLIKPLPLCISPAAEKLLVTHTTKFVSVLDTDVFSKFCRIKVSTTIQPANLCIPRQLKIIRDALYQSEAKAQTSALISIRVYSDSCYAYNKRMTDLQIHRIIDRFTADPFNFTIPDVNLKCSFEGLMEFLGAYTLQLPGGLIPQNILMKLDKLPKTIWYTGKIKPIRQILNTLPKEKQDIIQYVVQLMYDAFYFEQAFLVNIIQHTSISPKRLAIIQHHVQKQTVLTQGGSSHPGYQGPVDNLEQNILFNLIRAIERGLYHATPTTGDKGRGKKYRV